MMTVQVVALIEEKQRRRGRTASSHVRTFARSHANGPKSGRGVRTHLAPTQLSVCKTIREAAEPEAGLAGFRGRGPAGCGIKKPDSGPSGGGADGTATAPGRRAIVRRPVPPPGRGEGETDRLSNGTRYIRPPRSLAHSADS